MDWGVSEISGDSDWCVGIEAVTPPAGKAHHRHTPE